MSDVRVTALNVYPVKSCGGTPLHEAVIGPRGILHDREFMVVDSSWRFLTQRELPCLALIQPRYDGSRLHLEAPAMTALDLAPVESGPRSNVAIWRDVVMGVDQGDEVADWLSTFLGHAARLVRLPLDTFRQVDQQFAPRATDQVGFADAFPFLLISEESLEDLNTRLAVPLPMNRFRPNIVVRGWGRPYGEDTWGQLSIGEVVFDVVKACARCVTTTTDQQTAQRGAEPLVTLSRYRRVPRGVLFGQNLVHVGRGRIAVGDRLSVLRHAGRTELDRAGSASPAQA